MLKLRKNLPQTYGVLILPTDEAIDWQKTAEKLTQDKEYFSLLKELTFPDEELEVVKKKFIKNAAKLTVYDYYKSKGFNSDIIVAKDDYPLLKYVLKDFNITDLDILSENSESLGLLINSIKDKNITQKELGKTVLELLQNKELSSHVLKVIKSVLDSKLVKVIGADNDISREEIVDHVSKSLQYQDITALFAFIQSSIKLNLEKKNISQS